MSNQEPTGNLNSLLGDEFDSIPDEGLDKPIVLTQPPHGGPADNDVPSHRLFDGPIVERELPKFSAEFEIQEDKLNTLKDVLRVKSDIEHNGVISTEDIGKVDALLPGFVNDEHPSALYTDTPSKTNINEGLNNIELTIEKEYDDLRSSVSELCQQYIKVMGSTPETIKSKLYASIAGLNKAYAELLKNAECSDINGVKFILNNRERLSKFFTSYVCQSDPTNTTGDSSGLVSCDQSVAGSFRNTFVFPFIVEIAKISEETRVQEGIRWYAASIDKYVSLSRDTYRLDGNELVKVTDDELFRHIGSNDLRYQDLLNVLTSQSGLNLISILQQNYNKGIDVVSGCAKEISDIQEDTQMHITEKLVALTTISAKLNSAMQMNTKISIFLSGLFSLSCVFTRMLQELANKQKPVAIIEKPSALPTEAAVVTE